MGLLYQGCTVDGERLEGLPKTFCVWQAGLVLGIQVQGFFHFSLVN